MNRLWILLLFFWTLALSASHGRDFIQVKTSDGVYWLTDPDGKPFVSLGFNHFNAGFLTAPYNREFMAKKYGNDILCPGGRIGEQSRAWQAWFGSVFANMKAWGFNSFGMHVGREIPCALYRTNVFYLAWLKPVALDGWVENRKFPDVFSPELEERVARYVREEIQKYKDDVNVLGYCYSDVPQWVHVSRATGRVSSYPWVNAIRLLPPTAPGKRVYLAHLRQRHVDVASVNAVYGTSASTWDDLARLAQWPSPSDAARALKEDEAFATQIAERWYGLQHDCIRRHDAHHLILGDKLNFNLSPDAQTFLYPALSRHVDVVLVQYYGDHAPRAEALRELFASSRKPIINGDSSFAFPHANQPRSKGIKVGSYREVGERYARYLKDIMSEPFMVGWHYCGYMEGWAGAGKHLEHQSGLVDPFDQPYVDAIALIATANARAEEWHCEAGKKPR